MKVLICGDRYWTNSNLIEQELRKLPLDTIIVHGAARGADSIAGEIAERLFGKDNVKAYPADWNKHGKAAGLIRNNEILLKEQPDLILAFHNEILKSKGTKHMITIAEKARVGVKLITE